MLVFFRFVRHNDLLRHSSNSSVVILNVRAHSNSSSLSSSVYSKSMVFSSKRSIHAFRSSTFLCAKRTLGNQWPCTDDRRIHHQPIHEGNREENRTGKNSWFGTCPTATQREEAEPERTAAKGEVMIRHRQPGKRRRGRNDRTKNQRMIQLTHSIIESSMNNGSQKMTVTSTPPPVFILEKQKKPTQQRMTEIISIWTKVKIENTSLRPTAHNGD